METEVITEKERIRQSIDGNLEHAAEGEQVQDMGEAMAKIAMILAKSDNKKILTELTESEIYDFSQAYALAKYLEIPEITTVMNELMILKISKDRKGRQEIIEITQNMGAESIRAKQRGLLGNIVTLGGRLG